MLTRNGWGQSDIGQRRTSNEDSFLVDDALGLYVVADGMGGHRNGEVASREAIDALHSMVRQDRALLAVLDQVTPGQCIDQNAPPTALRKVQRVLESAIQSATYMVHALGEVDPDRRGMGTTLSALLLRRHYGVSAQVGDSRIYRIRDGSIIQLTEDHTLVAWQLKRGLISEDQARLSKERNLITRAVGSRDYVEVDLRILEVEPEDVFVLCSDGLYGHVASEELIDLARLGPQEAAAQAIALANHRGGHDNITALFVEAQ